MTNRPSQSAADYAPDPGPAPELDDAELLANSQRRVLAFLESFEDEGVGEQIARTHLGGHPERPVDLTTTDLRGLLNVAVLARSVIDYLAESLDRDGVLAEDVAASLHAHVQDWRVIEQWWTWWPKEAAEQAHAARAAGVVGPTT